MKSLGGRTYIITGATKGIGKVIAIEFLKVGASVVISGRDQKKLNSVKHEFEQMGFSPHSVPADLTNPMDCKRLVESSVTHFGRIDGLVNNAGVPARGKFEDIDSSISAMVIYGNLVTAMNCTREALPELMKSRGSVIFISSVAAIHGIPNAAPYSAAKKGLEKFAQSLRIEMQEHHVHVGILRPGLVDPPPDKKVLRADGTFQPVTHKGHQTQESVAKAVLRMIIKRRARITMTPIGKFLSIVNWLAPWIVRFYLTQTQNSARYEG